MPLTPVLKLLLDMRGLARRPERGVTRYARLLAAQVMGFAPHAGITVEAWESGPMPTADVVAVLDGCGSVNPGVPTLSVLYDIAPFVAPQTLSPTARWTRRWAVAWTARQSAGVLAPSRLVARAATDYLRVPAERLAWIGSLGPAWKRAKRGEVEDFRVRHHLKDRYFAFAGRLDRRHNLDLVLSAWERVRSRLPGTCLVAAGRGADRRVVDRVLAAGVTWIGELDEDGVRTLLSGATAALAPARAEGTSIAAWEALAVGAPVLALDGGAPAEVIGNAGLVLPDRDPDAWAAAMLALVEDSGRRNAMAARGLRASADLTGEESARRILALAAGVRSSS